MQYQSINICVKKIKKKVNLYIYFDRYIIICIINFFLLIFKIVLFFYYLVIFYFIFLDLFRFDNLYNETFDAYLTYFLFLSPV